MADIKKTRRVKLKQIAYAFKNTPVVLKGCLKHGPFERLCGIGSISIKEYDDWFIEDVNPGKIFLENIKQDIDVLEIRISEK